MNAIRHKEIIWHLQLSMKLIMFKKIQSEIELGSLQIHFKIYVQYIKTW